QDRLDRVNDIRDLAEVEAGRMQLQAAAFPLAEVVENSLSMVRERAARQGVAVLTHVDPSVGLLDADERKIKQILFNLLSNAVKFTPDGGQVTLAARTVGDTVEIAVSDTGVGIGV